jgi:site-specific recombinase XerD
MSGELVPLSPQSRDKLINDLTKQFLATRKSEHTADAYGRDLVSWWRWCERAGVHPIDARRGDVLQWLADLAATEKGTTRARRLGAVSSWYDWLVTHDVTDRNPATLRSRERPVRAPRRKPALSNADAVKLLAAADADTARSAALVWMLIYTGVRVSSILGASLSDLTVDRGHPVVDLPLKGDKRLRKPLPPPLYERLEAYLSTRSDVERLPAIAAGAKAPRPLFATSTGKRLRREDVRRLLRRLAAKAGLPATLVDTISPHTTRATYITASLEAGTPLRDVQYAVGHISPITTEGYDRSHLSPDRDPAYRLLQVLRTPTTEHREEPSP